MDDPARFESPVVATYEVVPDAALHLADESSIAKTLVRADATSYVGAQLGVRFGSSRVLDDVLVCGQRPGEWMLLGTRETNAALVAQLDVSGHVSVIDVTHTSGLFRLTGDDAPRALEKICNLDWSDAMTPNGAVTSASVAKVNCDVIRDDRDATPSYLIACDRSFGQYLFDVTLDAGAEFTISPQPAPKF